jgi:hypothetical protein
LLQLIQNSVVHWQGFAYGYANIGGLISYRTKLKSATAVPRAALALKMRPTTSPLASTSKSSSFHSPEGREDEALFEDHAMRGASLLPLAD